MPIVIGILQFPSYQLYFSHVFGEIYLKFCFIKFFKYI